MKSLTFWMNYYLILSISLLVVVLFTTAQLLKFTTYSHVLARKKKKALYLFYLPQLLSCFFAAFSCTIYAIHLQHRFSTGLDTTGFIWDFSMNEWYVPYLKYLNASTDFFFLSSVVTLPELLMRKKNDRTIGGADQRKIFFVLYVLFGGFIIMNCTGLISHRIEEAASLMASLGLAALFLYSAISMVVSYRTVHLRKDFYQRLLRNLGICLLFYWPYLFLSLGLKILWQSKNIGIPSAEFNPFIAVTLLQILLAIPLLKENLRNNKEEQVSNYTVSALWKMTPREMDVLPYLLQGHSYNEIGQKLFVSTSTVKKHVLNIYRKAGVNSKTGLLSLCMKEHLTEKVALPLD